MEVVLIQAELHFPEGHSLKSKRLLLKSLLERLRNRHNVSVAQVDGWDLWQRATLAIAHVNVDRAHADALIEKIRKTLDGEAEMQVLDFSVEYL